MRFYHHVSVQQVLDSGKITESELKEAISEGWLTVIKEEATGKEWIDGAALHRLFGVDHFSHV